jgi:hypothetical protein
MASKIAWFAGKRGIIFAVTVVVAAVLGAFGQVHPTGLWDGPH